MMVYVQKGSTLLLSSESDKWKAMKLVCQRMVWADLGEMLPVNRTFLVICREEAVAVVGIDYADGRQYVFSVEARLEVE